MAEIDWIIPSETALIDAATGKLSIIGITRRLVLKNLPFTLQRFCISMRIIGDPFEEIPLDLAIIDPDGIVVSAGKGGVKFGTDGVVEQSIALKNVSFTKTGMYQIRISIPDSPPESLSFVVLLKG